MRPSLSEGEGLAAALATRWPPRETRVSAGWETMSDPECLATVPAGQIAQVPGLAVLGVRIVVEVVIDPATAALIAHGSLRQPEPSESAAPKAIGLAAGSAHVAQCIAKRRTLTRSFPFAPSLDFQWPQRR